MVVGGSETMVRTGLYQSYAVRYVIEYAESMSVHKTRAPPLRLEAFRRAWTWRSRPFLGISQQTPINANIDLEFTS